MTEKAKSDLRLKIPPKPNRKDIVYDKCPKKDRLFEVAADFSAGFKTFLE